MTYRVGGLPYRVGGQLSRGSQGGRGEGGALAFKRGCYAVAPIFVLWHQALQASLGSLLQALDSLPLCDVVAGQRPKKLA